MAQSPTTDQPIAPRGEDTEHSQPHVSLTQLKQPAVSYNKLRTQHKNAHNVRNNKHETKDRIMAVDWTTTEATRGHKYFFLA